jgi:hypothetical protein
MLGQVFLSPEGVGRITCVFFVSEETTQGVFLNVTWMIVGDIIYVQSWRDDVLPKFASHHRYPFGLSSKDDMNNIMHILTKQ